MKSFSYILLLLFAFSSLLSIAEEQATENTTEEVSPKEPSEMVEGEVATEAASDEVSEQEQTGETTSDELSEEEQAGESPSDELSEEEQAGESPSDELSGEEQTGESPSDELSGEEQVGESPSDEPVAEEPIEEPKTEEEIAAEMAAYIEKAKAIWDSVSQRTGGIALRRGMASLNVPTSFYYLSPADAEKVLVDGWDNPPGSGLNSLGMLFLKEVTPFDNERWAVTVNYEETGYISDADADALDYDNLMVQMQAAASIESARQEQQRFELIGWASQPYYDKAAHKMYWSKELKIHGEETNALNYRIQILGRKGILVLNFVATMNQLEVINRNLQTVIAMANFSPGFRYEDFDPKIDKSAGFGLAGMVSGDPNMKPYGIVTLALAFLKKFSVYIVAALAALVILGIALLVFKRKSHE